MMGGVTRMGGLIKTTSMLIVVFLFAVPAHAKLTFRYADHFSEAEQAKLKTWIREVHTGVEQLVGAYPFPIRITFERTRSDSPVPWAQTQRGGLQGVTFYVDPRFSIQDLREDWTAAHELSHLILPFVGQRNAWFSEGFASFMQYQVMHSMGVISSDEAEQRYLTKLRRSERDFLWTDLRFVDTTPALRQKRQYPVMYWGSAVFFFRLNAALVATGQTDMIDLLSQYLRCCRRNRSSLVDLIDSLDEVHGGPVVSDAFQQFLSVVGFPEFEDLAIGAIRPDRL